MRSPYQRKYTQRENLQIISYDPEGFKEGLFSVPAEIDGVDKVKLPDGVIMSQTIYRPKTGQEGGGFGSRRSLGH
jgi:hypothetical protein